VSLRDLPSVDSLVRRLDGRGLPRQLVTDVARAAIEEARSRNKEGRGADAEGIARDYLSRLSSNRIGEVINATGVLLHTNLGRAPWSAEAVSAAAAVGSGYSNVEFDLAQGGRSKRSSYLSSLLATLTGAEAGMAVNNNAGGLFLALTALAKRRKVVVSRGELIEIGGAYRLPELMAAAGAKLVEVGTTNRTRLSDYQSVSDEQPAVILKVHPSNYRIEGFTSTVSTEELAGTKGEAVLVYDVGSGLLDDRTPWLTRPPPWIAGEPGVRQAINGGADLVLFSGDKLLGGPQAGVVVGQKLLIDKLAKNPVARALRMDAASTAALISTLEAYADGHGGELPLWGMATLEPKQLAARCRRLIKTAGIDASVKASTSPVGAGSLPGAEIPTCVVAINEPPAEVVYPRLLAGQPPIVARRQEGSLLIDLRCVPEDRDQEVATALGQACR